MPRESSKCRAWEQERRNRLNVAFSTLSKLLPNYEPSSHLSKIDVLTGAASHIEELQEKIKALLAPNTENASENAKKTKGDELRTLHERVKKLLKRNETLCDLLHQAKITIPKNCTLKKWRMKCHLYWSNRILPEQATAMRKKELEKENDASSSNKKAPGRKLVKNSNAVPNSTPKHRKAVVSRDPARKVRRKKKQPNNCVIVLSQPSLMPQNCFVITQAPSNNILGTTTSVNSKPTILSNPVVSCKPAAKVISGIPPPLGPGTLIFTNGTILPVLPQIPQFVNPPQPLILVRKKHPQSQDVIASNAVSSKSFAKIRPKFCTTKTTQVNKVPIPALTSRYANKDLVLGENAKTGIKGMKKTNANQGEKRKTVAENATESKKSKVDDKKVQNNEAVPTETPKVTTEVTEKVDQVAVETNKVISTAVPTTIESAVKTSEEPVEKSEADNAKKSEVSIVPATSANSESANQMPPDLNINHSELSNDIFASLQVPSGCQNPESTSPTAAFLLAFPLVSSLNGVKVTEVTEEDNIESQRGTPTLLQIGTMDTTKPTQSESLTPSLLNLDNLSFFSSKDITGFCNSFESITTPVVTTTATSMPTSSGFYSNSYHNLATTAVATTTVTMTTSTGRFYNPYRSTVDTTPVTTATTAAMATSNNHFYNHTNTTVTMTTSLYNTYVATSEVATTSTVAVTTASSSFYNPSYSMSRTAVTTATVTPVTSKAVDNNSRTKPIERNNKENCLNNYFNNNCNNNFNDLSKICTTCSYATIIKSYPDPLYTNSNSYNYTSDTNFNQNIYKNIGKNNDNNRSYNYGLNYENYNDYRKSDTTNFNTNYYNATTDGQKLNNTQNKSRSGSNTNKGPINWMTTPDYNLQFNKDNNSEFPAINYTNQTYFNSTANNYTTNEPQPDNRKNFELPLMGNEENQFSWSPTKIPPFLDSHHPTFVSSTLPTLVGDLALNFDGKDNKKKENTNRRPKTYEQQTNFLSVSQLVENGKPARTTARRNSGNRNGSKKIQAQKTARSKESKESKQQQYEEERLFCANTNKSNNNRTQKSNYSAEALIGSQMQSKNHYPSKTLPPFLPEIPYFPMELQQSSDNNYNLQQNQNFNFNPGNYPANTFITAATTTNYLNSNNFIHDTTEHYHDNFNLFPASNRVQKHCSVNKTSYNTKKINDSSNNKRKCESNVPNFVDFSFLPPITSTSINSPILPDDFHSHTNFLQPHPTPQIYPCKNPLLKQNTDLSASSTSLLPLPRANIQLPEISPSINSAAAAGITNFNLSTIFPEINKGISENYLDSGRIKEHHRNYVPPVQVSLNEKPTFNFNYTSQSYNQ